MSSDLICKAKLKHIKMIIILNELSDQNVPLKKMIVGKNVNSSNKYVGMAVDVILLLSPCSVLLPLSFLHKSKI